LGKCEISAAVILDTSTSTSNTEKIMSICTWAYCGRPTMALDNENPCCKDGKTLKYLHV